MTLRTSLHAVIGTVLVIAGSTTNVHPALAIDCSRNDLSEMDMGSCATDTLNQSDARLNAVYANLRKKITPADQTRLRDAERAWLAYRDAECVFRTADGLHQEGDLWGRLVLQCKTELTDARVRDLAEQLKCPSWDLSGCH